MRTSINMRSLAFRTLPFSVLGVLGALGIAVFAQTSPVDETTTSQTQELNSNSSRVPRHSTVAPSFNAPVQTQFPMTIEAQADMTSIERSTPLLTADFEVVYQKERALDKSAAKMLSDFRSGKDSGRVPRFGAHIVAFNNLWQESTKCDDLYAKYLDRCANHFRHFHQPDVELALRQSPCRASVLAVMGNDYARLHHAVLVAHAERLKLLALERSLRTQTGIHSESDTSAQGSSAQAESAFDNNVRGQIMPARIQH